jgi:hypothetical protein
MVNFATVKQIAEDIPEARAMLEKFYPKAFGHVEVDDSWFGRQIRVRLGLEYTCRAFLLDETYSWTLKMDSGGFLVLVPTLAKEEGATDAGKG